MKYAGKEALDRLEPLLAELRRMPEISERNRGTFYRRSKAFLHFHEDAAGLFVDVRLRPGEGFERLPVTSGAERSHLLGEVRRALAGK